MRKPFFIKARKAWYLDITNGDGSLSRVRLGDNKKTAYTEWDRVKASSTVGEGSSATVFEVIGRYVEAFKEDIRNGRLGQTTLDARLTHLEPFIEEVGDGFQIADLKKHHLTTWFSKTPTWNATTQHHAAESVKRALNWAVDEGLIDKNPIEKVRFEKGAGRDFLVSEDHFVQLLSGYKIRRRDAMAFRLILIALRLSGCRPGEIPRIDLKHVKHDRWSLPKHKNVKKKRRPRVVYLSPCLQTLAMIARGKRTTGPLFISPSGSAWDYQDMRRRFHRLRRRSDSPAKFVMYSFRHTWITDALIAGIDVATVAEMAGTSIRMIDQHYGHLSRHKDVMIEAARIVAVRRHAIS